MKRWKVTLYRRDSHTPTVYENVKHAWWEHGRYVIAQFTNPASDDGLHHYWSWPTDMISHVREDRSA